MPSGLSSDKSEKARDSFVAKVFTFVADLSRAFLCARETKMESTIININQPVEQNSTGI